MPTDLARSLDWLHLERVSAITYWRELGDVAHVLAHQMGLSGSLTESDVILALSLNGAFPGNDLLPSVLIDKDVLRQELVCWQRLLIGHRLGLARCATLKRLRHGNRQRRLRVVRLLHRGAISINYLVGHSHHRLQLLAGVQVHRWCLMEVCV